MLKHGTIAFGDLAAFGRAAATLLKDHERAARLGREATAACSRTTSHPAD
jgi:hypothetical protein